MIRLRSIAIRLTLALAATAALPAATAWADLELPAPSPAAKVSQRVGITDISLEYSSPAVDKRKIFGDLVPWNKPWRTGANAATKITFSREVNFGGAAVPAGTYAIVSFPSDKGWQIALNKDLGINVADHTYDPKDELVKVKATTSAIPHRERMTFLFDDTKDDQTSLDLEWDKLRVSVAIKVDTAAHVAGSIKTTLDTSWRPYANTARYLAEKKADYPAALDAIDKSIALKVTWFNNWIKADILHRQGNNAEALKFAQIAKDLGDKEPAGAFFYKDMVEKALVEWKGKK
jgi:hypothetical protein